MKIRQPRFSFGAVGKALHAGVDLNFYALGLRQNRNCFIERAGCTSSRSGTLFCGQTPVVTGDHKLIPFIFSPDPDQAYALEFGDFLMRVYLDDELVTEDATAITGATQADPCVVTSVAHGLATGNRVIIPSRSVLGMRELNRRQYLITVLTADTFSLQDLSGNDIDSTTFGTYVSGGEVAKVFELATPYSISDVFRLYYAQSADVMTLTHPSYPAYELTREDHDDWTLTAVEFGPGIDSPDNLSLATPSGLAGITAYQVTSIKRDTGEESIPGGLSAQDVEEYTLTAIGSVVNIKVTGHGAANGDRIHLEAITVVKNITAMSGVGGGAEIVWAVPSHGYANGDSLDINSLNGTALFTLAVYGATSPHGLAVSPYYTIQNVTADTFELVGFTSTGAFVYNPGGVIGTVSQPYLAAYTGFDWTITVVDPDNFTLDGAVTAADAIVTANTEAVVSGNAATAANSGSPSAADPNILTWDAVPGAMQYRVYKVVNGLGCFIGSTVELTFTDEGFEEDPADNPPAIGSTFTTTGEFPGIVAYYQQRLLLGRKDNSPEAFDGSKIGAYHNFTVHVPVTDLDSIRKINLAGNQVNEIRHMLDLNKLVLLTSGSEMVANGDSAGTLTANQINLKTYGYNGCSYVRPVVVDNVVVFVQYSGAQLVAMKFDEFGRQEAVDLSLSNLDFFEGHTIVDMAYQKTPHSIIWLVRDDGKLLSFTYRPDQGVQGWSIHDTDGDVKSVCCIPGDGQDDLYMVVERDGFQYVEKMADRRVLDIVDYNGMDAAGIYDGRYRDGIINVRLEGGSTWLAGESMTARASAGTPFEAADVGSSIFVRGNEEDHDTTTMVRCLITAYASATEVTVTPNKTVPVGLRTVYTEEWDLAAIRVHELWHLEGRTLAVLKDGGVYASPNNSDYTNTVTVASGSILLTDAGGVVAAGIPFLADVEPLNIDTNQGTPLIGKMKLMKTVYLFVKDTLGVWAGPKPPEDDDDDPLQNLDEFSPADIDDSDPDAAQAPISDVIKIPIPGSWNSNGRVFIRQVDPLPMTILSIAPAGSM